MLAAARRGNARGLFRVMCTDAPTGSKAQHLRGSTFQEDFDRRVHVVGCPIDIGPGRRRGVDMCATMLRASDLKTRIQSTGYDVADHGNVEVSQDLLRHIRRLRRGGSQQSDEAFFSENIQPHVSDVLEGLAQETYSAVKANGLPLVLGGDNCTTVGGLVGAQRARAEMAKLPLGLLVFNAHAGCNTWKTTKSQQLRGMTLSALLGASVAGFDDLTRSVTHDGETGEAIMLPSGSRKSVVDVTRCCIIGLRDVDAGERDHMTALGLRRQKNFFTMRDLDELGMLEVMRRALQTVAPSGGPFALSIDMDCMDPGVAPGTGTQVPGGLSYREGHLAMEVMADHGGLRYMDVVEMNPISDKQNVTGNMAVNMVECVLGKEIY